jgi:hypothetical protein
MKAIPDFSAPRTSAWWDESVTSFLADNFGANMVEGLVLTHNSPYVLPAADACVNLTARHLYVPDGIRDTFGKFSVCPDAAHAGGVDHLSLHNGFPPAQMRANGGQPA